MAKSRPTRKSKPAARSKSKPVVEPAVQSHAKIQARAYRAAKNQPVTVRFSQRPPDVSLEVAEPHRLADNTIRVKPDRAGQPGIVEFSVVADLAGGAAAPQHLDNFEVIIESGGHRYAEQIFADVRPQVFRYHFYFSEPTPDMILCAVHGLVKAKNGRCPGKHT
jgi:hypothetical protein